MKILITGATGFIGQYLVPLLKDHRLLLLGLEDGCYTQSDVSYVQADLGDDASWKKKVEEFAPEAGIHLAWKGLPDYSFGFCLENFVVSARLFDFLAGIGCKKILVTGSCWEYGNAHGMVKEDQSGQGAGLFASFKTSLRLVGESLSAKGGFAFVWARLFFVYGPGQRGSSLIPSCYTAMSGGREPELKDPHAVCDFIHVSDVAAALKALVESDNISGIFNIGSGNAAEVSLVRTYAAKALNFNVSHCEAVRSSEKNGFWADISRISDKTGWKPKISLQQGVESTVLALRSKV